MVAASAGTWPHNETLWNIFDNVGFTPPCRPANLTTFAHFSVSSATSLVKLATEPESGSLPRSAIRPFTAGSASAALTSRLSRSTVSIGVPLGTPTPSQPITAKPWYNIADRRNARQHL